LEEGKRGLGRLGLFGIAMPCFSNVSKLLFDLLLQAGDKGQTIRRPVPSNHWATFPEQMMPPPIELILAKRCESRALVPDFRVESNSCGHHE
jgi:hypothetical protein